MTPVLRWNEQPRARLNELLPEALVVLPIGATEQHGPHLATGTDAQLVATVTERAAEQADDCPRALVLAPTIPVGASDHHLSFGGTLSLSPETLHALLLDVARSVVACGGRRLVVVNGHGGNHGVAHAAGAAASNRYDIAVATTDYWRLFSAASTTADPVTDPQGALTVGAGAPIPGHAGAFETSLVLATRPELVAERGPREGSRKALEVAGFDVHSKASWAGMDGFTDEPATANAEDGRVWLNALAEALAKRLAELATTL